MPVPVVGTTLYNTKPTNTFEVTKITQICIRRLVQLGYIIEYILVLRNYAYKVCRKLFVSRPLDR